MTISYELANCPACGAAEAHTIASAEDVRAEVEALWRFHLARRVPGVPADQLFDRVFFSTHAPLRIAQCDRCGTLYRDPRESAREVMETYAGEEPNERVLEALLDAQKPAYRAQVQRLTRMVGHVGNGLEVGSYVGGFLAAARELGWTMTGVDLNATANAFARAHGLAIQTGTLDDAPCGPFDAIAIWNCFDQLADPRGTLRAARQRLRVGGVLALRVANGACYRRLRVHAVARPFLAWNNLLAFPYRQGFTPSSLASLLRFEGFELLEIRGDTLPLIADRWTKSWARLEERAVKRLLRASPVSMAPWFEIYATV